MSAHKDATLDSLLADPAVNALLPSDVLRVSGLGLVELHARTVAFSVRRGVDPLEGGRILKEHLRGILATRVDLSGGYEAFLRNLVQVDGHATTVTVDERITVDSGTATPEARPAPVDAETASTTALRPQRDSSFFPFRTVDFISPDRMEREEPYTGFFPNDVESFFHLRQYRFAELVSFLGGREVAIPENREGRYDLRGVAHHFLPAQGFFSKGETIEHLENLLAVNGVQDKFTGGDAIGILAAMERLDPLVLEQGTQRYDAGIVRADFLPAAVEFYDTRLMLTPARIMELESLLLGIRRRAVAVQEQEKKRAAAAQRVAPFPPRFPDYIPENRVSAMPYAGFTLAEIGGLMGRSPQGVAMCLRSSEFREMPARGAKPTYYDARGKGWRLFPNGTYSSEKVERFIRGVLTLDHVKGEHIAADARFILQTVRKLNRNIEGVDGTCSGAAIRNVLLTAIVEHYDTETELSPSSRRVVERQRAAAPQPEEGVLINRGEEKTDRFPLRFADYIPENRVDSEAVYAGFSIPELADMFELTEKGVHSRLRSLKSTFGPFPIRAWAPTYYDLRGMSYAFLARGKNGTAQTKIDREDALHLLEQVLMVDGVKEKYRARDAEGILNAMEKVYPAVKNENGEYHTHAMADAFLPAVVKHYKTEDDLAPKTRERMNALLLEFGTKRENTASEGKRARSEELSVEDIVDNTGESVEEKINKKEEEEDRKEEQAATTRKKRRPIFLAEGGDRSPAAIARAALSTLELDITELTPPLSVPLITKTIDDFVTELDQGVQDLFPNGYAASQEKVVAAIYRKRKDRISFPRFAALLRQHVKGELLPDPVLEYDHKRLKTAAILERMGVTEISVDQLGQMYTLLGTQRKISWFSKETRLVGGRGAKTTADFWGEEWKYEITRLRKEGIDRTEKRKVYDAIGLLHRPWLDAIYFVVTTTAKYAEQQLRSGGEVKKKGKGKRRGNDRSETETRVRFEVPRERCVTEYKGFTAREVAELFGYDSEIEVETAIARLRTVERAVIPTMPQQGREPVRYDLRLEGEALLPTGRHMHITSMYTRETALDLVTKVLKVRGVQERYLSDDAEAVLRAMERTRADHLLFAGRYMGRELRTGFSLVLPKAYDAIMGNVAA